ncbi:uncharacterized protein LOC119456222 isoform X5 [Dermacentor silvarum]|uniref:uncharacterized protein LOC119456222 isoform X5 n=1 Tax=Dermacentor silvarum TaxID=543639 RepID=UPI0018989872|nr:uncharacterized protein LOC119456222 isoform X5 [Dermacentor silvarum]
MASPDILSVMENYRQSTLSRLTAWCLWFGHLILHPTSAWKSSTLWHKVQLFFCYILSCISVGYHEKKTLLEWVRSRVKNYPVPDNFSSGWKDGILLCALLDSMYPGSCPRYDLLNADNCISNAQLAFFLLEKHTPIRPDITAEELAEGSPNIEKAVRAIVSRLKVISAKAQLQQALGKRPSIKDDGGEDSSSLVARKNCFAKGMGLILAVRGRKASFNVFTKSTSNFCIVVEIRGPDNTVCKEIITNKSPRRKVTANSPEADKSAPDGAGQDDKKILIEYDIHPGMVAVKYTPVLKGKHQLSIIWHGQHLAGSPFTVNVDDSTDYADDLLLQRQDSVESQSSEKDEKLYPAPASPTSAAQLKGKIKRRRVLRRIVNVNGQDIVIEGDDKDKLCEVLRSLSSNVFRQNGGDYSSGREKRTAATADGTRVAKPFFSPASSPESSPDTYSYVDYGKSLWERSKHAPSKLAMPEIIVSSCSPHASEEERTPEIVAEASADRRCPDALGGRASPTVNVSLSGRASPCGTVSPSGTITPSGRVSPSGTLTPSGRVSPCGRTSPNAFPEVSEFDEFSSATLNSAGGGSSAARALFVSDMLRQETGLPYSVASHELEGVAHLPSEGEGGDATFVGAESPAVNDDLVECAAHKQLERTLSIISEESDKSPSDQMESPESGDSADKIDTPPSYEYPVTEADGDFKPSQLQPDETAFASRPVPSERHSRMSVLERAKSLESACPQPSPVKRQLSQFDVSLSQQAPLSKLDELYLDTVKLKQFFTENFKKTMQTSSTTHTFISSGDRDEFVSVRDMVKVWEHRQSPNQCGSPEQVSPRGDANGRQGVERRFRVTQVAASSKENEPDLVKDAIHPQAARRQLPCSVDSGDGSSGQSSEDKGTTTWSDRALYNKTQRQRRCNTQDTLRFPHYCRADRHGNTCRPPTELDRTPVQYGSDKGDRGSVTICCDVNGPSSSTAHSTTRPVSPTLVALRKRNAPLCDFRDNHLRQRESYRRPSYEFWFGAHSEEGGGECSRATENADRDCLLRRHPSTAAGRSDEDASEEEDYAESEDGSAYSSSCEYGSEYIDDALHDSSLILESYASFELVKSSSEVVGGLYYDCREPDDELFAEPTSRPEKCLASGARLYFGQVGTENHFQVSTKDAGKGPLSVSVQGPNAGSVINVSVTYCGQDEYTVTYKVIEPGYYIIHIKWAEWPIPDSPVMCKVTA